MLAVMAAQDLPIQSNESIYYSLLSPLRSVTSLLQWINPLLFPFRVIFIRSESLASLQQREMLLKRVTSAAM